MKKILSVVLSVSMFACITAGCGSTAKSSGTTAAAAKATTAAVSATKAAAATTAAPAKSTAAATTAKSASKGKVAVKVWNRDSGTKGPFFDLVAAFNASQDKIEVTYEPYGENYNDMLNIALNSDDPPDIFFISAATAPVSDYAKAGKITPLDDILTEDFKKKFDPNTFKLNEFSYQGHTYTVPLRLQHYKLLYNKDLFAKANLSGPPKTLEELRDDAKKITEQGGGKVYGLGLYTNYKQFWLRYEDMINIPRGKSGTYGFDYKTGKFDFSTQKDLFNYWVNVYKDGSTFPGAVTLGVEQMRANFAQGLVGMMIDGNWMTTQYATNIPTTINWDAVPLPLFEGEKRAKDYITCDISFCISAKGKHVEEAKTFYKFMLENQVKVRDYGDCDTKTFTAANEKSAFQHLPSTLKFQGLDEMSNVKDHSVFTVEPQKFITLEGDNRDTVLNNQFALAIDGKGDIDAALSDLTKRYNAALDKAVADGLLKKEELAPSGFDYFTR